MPRFCGTNLSIVVESPVFVAKPTTQEVKQNIFSLTVNKCDHPDVGTYRVHVDNGIDHTDQTAKLNVGGTFLSSSN